VAASTLMEEKEGADKPIGLAVCRHHFSGFEDQDEHLYLVLKVGEIVEVLKAPEAEDWWFGRIGVKLGNFPKDFVDYPVDEAGVPLRSSNQESQFKPANPSQLQENSRPSSRVANGDTPLPSRPESSASSRATNPPRKASKRPVTTPLAMPNTEEHLNNKKLEKEQMAWEEHFDHHSNRQFFHNTVTGETSWTKPQEMVEFEAEQALQSGGCPWEEHMDHSTGKKFFHNWQTNETQWDKPQELIDWENSQPKNAAELKVEAEHEISNLKVSMLNLIQEIRTLQHEAGEKMFEFGKEKEAANINLRKKESEIFHATMLLRRKHAEEKQIQDTLKQNQILMETLDEEVKHASVTVQRMEKQAKNQVLKLRAETEEINKAMRLKNKFIRRQEEQNELLRRVLAKLQQSRSSTSADDKDELDLNHSNKQKKIPPQEKSKSTHRGKINYTSMKKATVVQTDHTDPMLNPKPAPTLKLVKANSSSGAKDSQSSAQVKEHAGSKKQADGGSEDPVGDAKESNVDLTMLSLFTAKTLQPSPITNMHGSPTSTSWFDQGSARPNSKKEDAIVDYYFNQYKRSTKHTRNEDLSDFVIKKKANPISLTNLSSQSNPNTPAARKSIPATANTNPAASAALGSPVAGGATGAEKTPETVTAQNENTQSEMTQASNEKSGPSSVTFARTAVAKYQFAGDHADDLCFNVGDVITITSTADPEWWVGQLNGNFGQFPASFVQIEPDKTEMDVKTIRASSKLEVEHSTELSFEKEDVTTVTEQSEHSEQAEVTEQPQIQNEEEEERRQNQVGTSQQQHDFNNPSMVNG